MGPGSVDMKKVEQLAKQWGKLPAKEREANIMGLVRDMDPRYRDLIQEYFRRVSGTN
jgi:hypothetical protein